MNANIYIVSITSGQCHNLNFAGWGAEVFVLLLSFLLPFFPQTNPQRKKTYPNHLYRYNPNSNQNCVLKFWDTAGCTGKATTWFMSGGTTGNKCFASARQGGVNQFGAGVKSVIANCAFDVVPT